MGSDRRRTPVASQMALSTAGVRPTIGIPRRASQRLFQLGAVPLHKASHRSRKPSFKLASNSLSHRRT